LYEVSGRQVVVIIDEYDKPLLDTFKLFGNPVSEQHINNDTMFYSRKNQTCEGYRTSLLNDMELHEAVRSELKGFYGV